MCLGTCLLADHLTRQSTCWFTRLLPLVPNHCKASPEIYMALYTMLLRVLIHQWLTRSCIHSRLIDSSKTLCSTQPWDIGGLPGYTLVAMADSGPVLLLYDCVQP